MVDIVSKKRRSQMMAGIRGSNTKPEIAVRKCIFAAGFRYRLHVSDIPGRPDIVLPRFRAAVLVHGCFWHGHDCHLFKWPASRPEFWRGKINANKERDAKTRKALRALGWRVMTVWECAVKGRQRLDQETISLKLSRWIESSSPRATVSGKLPRSKKRH